MRNLFTSASKLTIFSWAKRNSSRIALLGIPGSPESADSTSCRTIVRISAGMRASKEAAPPAMVPPAFVKAPVTHSRAPSIAMPAKGAKLLSLKPEMNWAYPRMLLANWVTGSWGRRSLVTRQRYPTFSSESASISNLVEIEPPDLQKRRRSSP